MEPETVARKLLIKPGTALWLSDPPLASLLGTLPEGVTTAIAMGPASVAVIFAHSAAQVRELLDAHASELASPGVLWVIYRKANRADVNRNSLWHLIAGYGLRPITQVAVDDEWSALRFRPLKPGE